MQMKDWFIVISGLMALDGGGPFEYLPFEDLVVAANQQHGVPQSHFLGVAFVAGLIEDVSQIAHQITFIVSI